MTDQTVPQLLTLSAASKLLSVHPNTLRQWDKKGILQSVRFCQRKDRRYKKEDILRLMHGRDKP